MSTKKELRTQNKEKIQVDLHQIVLHLFYRHRFCILR